MYNHKIGKIGEDAATQILETMGYSVLKRNYRCKYGEVDIIASKDECLTFIEVKTRTGYRFGRPCEAIDEGKQRRIRMTANHYLKSLKAFDYVPNNVRFSVMEIVAELIDDAF